ncbi:hypothetical protein [Pseudoalteromonas piratica]|uniref:Uncharacterized protein n=1 Tax=Pseudoalteromonas piratica TaxID=1348114 RepID=A0A0A7EN48_9GAMM|nr:hypothetical protein [Pseudoalteromonas piratica]AIY67412.1 hypothetical protein OM33_20490 [Pseudoalteromonas piratica]
MTRNKLLKLLGLANLLVFSFSGYASMGWLPNVVHYINADTPLSAPQPEIALISNNFQESSLIDWHNFGGEGYIYTLSFQLAGSNEWVELYQGEQSYFATANTLASGTYTFRLSCDGVQGCPAEGYITSTIDIVQKPSFVNAEFDHQQQSVHVYWSDLAQVAGYTVEQTADNGQSWQAMNPEQGTGVEYQGDNYSGQIHTQNHVVLSNEVVTQGIQAAKALHKQWVNAKKTQASGADNTRQMTSSATSTNSAYEVGSELQYRVRACATQQCGEDEYSKVLPIVNLNGLISDPGFEQGQVQFEADVGATLAIDSSAPINQQKSLTIDLKNYGLVQYIHRYAEEDYPILNGATITGRLRINSIDKDSRISILPIAYYDGYNHRVEGQKLEFDASDIGRNIQLKGAVWLDSEDKPENKIKRLYFSVRLMDEGSANITLDDVQLYEGGGLAQTDPTLTSYYSNYSGLVKTGWSQFYQPNAVYHLEYKERKQSAWQTFYKGVNTEFESDVPLETGIYDFRIACSGIGNCPEPGYVTATTVIVREPYHLTVKVDDNKTYLDWSETASALGYLLDKSTDNGVSWQPVTPQSGDPQRTYTANDGETLTTLTVFDTTALAFTGVATAGTKYRVKACRWAGCKGRFRVSNGIYSFTEKPLTVNNFFVDKTSIEPGESIQLFWERPDNYSKDFYYQLHVTKPSGDGYPTVPRFLWEDNVKVHAISRGRDTGIQRIGTQTIDIRACNAHGCSEQLQQVEVTVQGPPPAPHTFTVDNANITVRDIVSFTWTMSPNYQEAVTFNLGVLKPNGNDFVFLQNSEATKHNRQINMPGKHQFYLEACNADKGCGNDKAKLNVYVSGVMQSGNTHYVVIATEAGVRYLSLIQVNDEWQINSLTEDAWHALDAYSNFSLSSYSVTVTDLSQDGLVDITLSDGSNDLVLIQNSDGDFVITEPDGVTIPLLEKTEGTLTWSIIANAESYELQYYACGESCGNYIEINWQPAQPAQSDTATSYILPADEVKRAYRVKACFADESCTAWSNVWEPLSKKKIIYIHTDLLGSPVAETL